jgi:hypothetical protein
VVRMNELKLIALPRPGRAIGTDLSEGRRKSEKWGHRAGDEEKDGVLDERNPSRFRVNMGHGSTVLAREYSEFQGMVEFGG